MNYTNTRSSEFHRGKLENKVSIQRTELRISEFVWKVFAKLLQYREFYLAISPTLWPLQKKFVCILAIWGTFCHFFYILGTIYQEVVLYLSTFLIDTKVPWVMVFLYWHRAWRYFLVGELLFSSKHFFLLGGLSLT